MRVRGLGILEVIVPADPRSLDLEHYCAEVFCVGSFLAQFRLLVPVAVSADERRFAHEELKGGVRA